MGSYIKSLWPLAECLTYIEKVFGKRFSWSVDSDARNEVVALINHPALDSFRKAEELSTAIAEDAETINVFLRERGFGITIKPFIAFENGEYKIAVAAILSTNIMWFGAPAVIETNQKMYHAFEIVAKMCDSRLHIVGLDGSVCELDCDGMADLHGDVIARIPNIRLNYTTPDCPLLGMRGLFFGPIQTLSGDLFGDIGPNRIRVDQAVQQSVFAMSRDGVVFESAVAMQMTVGSGCCPVRLWPMVVIDRPFNLRFLRNGIEVVSGYFDYDSWSRHTPNYAMGSIRQKINYA